MKNTNCRHCLNSCKVLGKKECEMYSSKSDRPEQLRAEIKTAYRNKEYEKARSMEEELFRKEYGA